MKGPKGLKEIHEIMEKLYAEEKELSAQQRIRKIKEEAETFLRERKLSLRRIKPKEPRKVAI